MTTNIEEIKTYIEEQESKTSVGQLDENLESFWFDIKISSRLENDTKLLEYATLFLSEEKTIFTTFQLQFLELKASLTCPYFADFKLFLEELKKWENTNENTNSSTIDTIWDEHLFLWIKVSDIKSQPYYKPVADWSTRCAKTARFNWLDFGLALQSGNAYDAGTLVPTVAQSYVETIPDWKENERPNTNWSARTIYEFKNMENDNINFADIYTDSKSTYGHRAVAFKDVTWQWYVLDPYTRVNGILDNSPKKLEDYMSQRKIVKSHFYTSTEYNPEARKYS